MSGSKSSVPDMISDGKRMRVVWRPGDGDGDSTLHVVERTKNILRGHPTWKIFHGDIPQPIMRNSGEELPRHVYLDDASAYAVYKSQQYTAKELNTYWPFDFDHQGNIKTGRSNRGRPAWADSEALEIAKGKLRGKKWYAFTGEPETSEYKPLRPHNKTKSELEVEAEWATREVEDAGLAYAKESTPDTPLDTTRLEIVSGLRSSPPKHPPPPPSILDRWQTSELTIPSKTVEGETETEAKQSSTIVSYLAGDDLHVPDSLSTRTSVSNTFATPKRKVRPFLDSSSSSPDTLFEHKRVKLSERIGSVATVSHWNQRNNQEGEQHSRPMSLEFPGTIPDLGDDHDSDDEGAFLASMLAPDSIYSI